MTQTGDEEGVLLTPEALVEWEEDAFTATRWRNGHRVRLLVDAVRRLHPENVAALIAAAQAILAPRREAVATGSRFGFLVWSEELQVLAEAVDRYEAARKGEEAP